MERLEPEIRAELSRFGPPGGMPDVLAAWPASVGALVAANAWPARMGRDGTLYVSTASSAWSFELTQLAPLVLERLREELGENAPTALRFSVGHLPEPAVETAGEAERAALQATPEALQIAADLTAEIDDAELRKRVARAAALSLSKGRSDSSF